MTIITTPDQVNQWIEQDKRTHVSPIEKLPSCQSYLYRIKAVMRTLYKASVEIKVDKYEKEHFSVIWDREDGSCRWFPETSDLAPTKEEAEDMQREVSEANRKGEFPTQVSKPTLVNNQESYLINNAKESDLYKYYDEDGQIIFVQVRVDYEDRDKRYVPQTYWSDGYWRAIEPEDGLPIFNGHMVRSGDRIFIHEGAKAARAADRICAGESEADRAHPFHVMYASGVHVGWIGGVNHLGRTNWSLIVSKTNDVIIVPDADKEGMRNINKIASKFDCRCSYIHFDSSWPKGWDSADDIPEDFFTTPTAEGNRIYNGRRLEDLLRDCTFATEQWFPSDEEGKKKHYRVRQSFADQWTYVTSTEQFVNLNRRDIALSKTQLNSAYRNRSHVKDLSDYLLKTIPYSMDNFTFMPELGEGPEATVGSETHLNQYVDHRMPPVRGTKADTAIFWEYLEYLIPKEEERRLLVRWVATLYAQPETRMGFGVLLLSTQQGTGKSTFLGICSQLIGASHVASPSNEDLQSKFNSWVAKKRLVAVDEIYAGASFSVYTKLKSMMTDEKISIDTKFVAPYVVPNRSHYLACSNSKEALKIEDKDRRWFLPTVTELLMSKEKYDELHKWIRSGGAAYLAAELLGENEFITAGEKPIETAAKIALTRASKSMGELKVMDLLDLLGDQEFVRTDDLVNWCQDNIKDSRYLKVHQVAEIAGRMDMHVVETARGGFICKDEVKYAERIFGLDESGINKLIRKNAVTVEMLSKDQESM